MKQFLVIVLIIPLLVFIIACKDDADAKNATAYVTADSIGGTMTVVKFLEPTANSASEPNINSNYIGTTVYNGWTWYLYEVASKEYDVYVEQTGGIGFNGRARIYLNAEIASSEWAAVYFDTGGNLWGEEGGGSFAPILSMYP